MGCIMSDFVISLLELIIIPFGSTDNLIVFVPTCCLTVVFCFQFIKRLI